MIIRLTHAYRHELVYAMTTFDSNTFAVTVTAQSQFSSVAAATPAGTFSAPLTIDGLKGAYPRLDPRLTTGMEFPDCAGDTTVATYSNSRAWILGVWSSDGC